MLGLIIEYLIYFIVLLIAASMFRYPPCNTRYCQSLKRKFKLLFIIAGIIIIIAGCWDVISYDYFNSIRVNCFPIKTQLDINCITAAENQYTIWGIIPDIILPFIITSCFLYLIFVYPDSVLVLVKQTERNKYSIQVLRNNLLFLFLIYIIYLYDGGPNWEYYLKLDNWYKWYEILNLINFIPFMLTILIYFVGVYALYNVYLSLRDLKKGYKSNEKHQLVYFRYSLLIKISAVLIFVFSVGYVIFSALYFKNLSGSESEISGYVYYSLMKVCEVLVIPYALYLILIFIMNNEKYLAKTKYICVGLFLLLVLVSTIQVQFSNILSIKFGNSEFFHVYTIILNSVFVTIYTLIDLFIMLRISSVINSKLLKMSKVILFAILIIQVIFIGLYLLYLPELEQSIQNGTDIFINIFTGYSFTQGGLTLLPLVPILFYILLSKRLKFDFRMKLFKQKLIYEAKKLYYKSRYG